MEVTVMAFGQLAELVGESFTMNNVQDTDALTQQLHQQFPSIASIPYKIAINKKMINANTVINDNASIALLPPFSGG